MVEDISEFVGKEVVVTTLSGTRYIGKCWRRGKYQIFLTHMTGLYNNGREKFECSSGRRFNVKKLSDISFPEKRNN